jgi:hypothetical protein
VPEVYTVDRRPSTGAYDRLKDTAATYYDRRVKTLAVVNL